MLHDVRVCASVCECVWVCVRVWEGVSVWGGQRVWESVVAEEETQKTFVSWIKIHSSSLGLNFFSNERFFVGKKELKCLKLEELPKTLELDRRCRRRRWLWQRCWRRRRQRRRQQQWLRPSDFLARQNCFFLSEDVNFKTSFVLGMAKAGWEGIFWPL